MRRRVPTEPTSDGGFFAAALVLGFAMLTLFAVLLLADGVGFARILPFAAVPALLFGTSAVLAWRWATEEAEAAVVRDEGEGRRERKRTVTATRRRS